MPSLITSTVSKVPEKCEENLGIPWHKYIVMGRGELGKFLLQMLMEWCWWAVFLLRPTPTCDTMPRTPQTITPAMYMVICFNIQKHIYYSIWSLCQPYMLHGTLTSIIQSSEMSLWVTAQGFTLPKRWIMTWTCDTCTSISLSEKRILKKQDFFFKK